MRITRVVMSLIMTLLVTMKAEAESTLLLGLLDITDGQEQLYLSDLDSLERNLKKKRCKLAREGQVLKSAGNLLSQKVKRFFLFQCRRDLIAKPKNIAFFAFQKDEYRNLILLEGRVDKVDFPSNEKMTDRLYVIKLGKYNNLDPLSRSADLTAVNDLAATRSPSFENEAFFFVDSAFGIERPDEVTFLYYPNPEAAQQFRSENTDILKRIGKFNSDHLKGFNYINAQSNR